METTLETTRNGHSVPRPRHNGHSPAAPRARHVLCPTCLTSNHIEKVSSVVRRGRGRLVWENGDTAHYETELAELLAVPSAPKRMSPIRVVMAALIPMAILAVILFALDFLGDQQYVSLPSVSIAIARVIAIAWFGLLVPGVVIVRYLRTTTDYRLATSAWVEARRRWANLYYCAIDDIVFAPGLKATAPVAEIDWLLHVQLPTDAPPAPAPAPEAHRLNEAPATD